MKLYVSIFLLLLPLIAASSATAQPGDDSADAGRTVSITLSTLPLIEPVVQIAAEWHAQKDVGFAGFIAAGGNEGPIFATGIQLIWYALGDFEHGVQLGGDLMFSIVDRASNVDLYEDGTGIALAAFAGYKLVMPFGFTANLQGGIRMTQSKRLIEYTVGGSLVSYYDYKLEPLPLVNINVGWSF